MDQKNNSQSKTECPCFPMTIGRTTYLVRVHFSETSKETLEDKIMRLFENDLKNTLRNP